MGRRPTHFNLPRHALLPQITLSTASVNNLVPFIIGAELLDQ